jgi:mono/diheme cytochrome c family protein
MICRPMSRLVKIMALCASMMGVAGLTAACGTQRVRVPGAQSKVYRGAELFHQRCGGCHTLSYAATYGSAPNIRTAQAISGPNFNQRCERPIDRVLYAIENGGFSGAYMPQNIVVGQDAVDVAKFVATYAGRQEPKQTGVVPCEQKPIGSLPAGSGYPMTTSTSASAPPPSSAISGGRQKNGTSAGSKKRSISKSNKSRSAGTTKSSSKKNSSSKP